MQARLKTKIPQIGESYGPDFPNVTIRDIVLTHLMISIISWRKCRMNMSDLILLLFAAMPPEIAVPAVAEIQPLAPPYVAYETGAARSTPFVTLVGGMDGGARGGGMGGMS